MEVANKPQLVPLSKGKIFKTLEVKGSAGTNMPPHHATEEAVVVVKKGRAELIMPKERYLLKAGSSFIIPAKVVHSLMIMEDFEAVAVMATNAKINFN